VRGGRIVAAGPAAQAMATAGEGAWKVDLAGRALLPGFVDGHGHLAKLAANMRSANLAPPPVGNVTSIAGLQAALRDHIASRGIAAGGWVRGHGYDPAFLVEARHPTRDDLDQVSRDHPIYISHVSGHLAAANSLAMQLAGVTAATPDPTGGVIRRRPGSGEPDGVFEENAMGLFADALPRPSLGEQLDDLDEAQQVYASYGITMAQEGAMFPAEQQVLLRAAEESRLTIDVAGYAFWAMAGEMLGDNARQSRGRFRNAGVKLMLDGSPQGKTAWLTDPYHVPPNGRAPDYRGYPTMPDARVAGVVEMAFEQGWQVIAHCNGDAACEQLIEAVESGRRASPGSDRRTVMIHAQTVREDQLERMAGLDMTPSFFASHVYYWGDYHRDSVLGPARAARISPMRSAHRAGLRFNLHNDAPVVPPDILRLVWCAAARRTRSGKVLGEDQAISVEDALRAVTIDAAWAHFEEGRRGSIEVGKLADLVVLSADPTAVPLEGIPEIRIVATLKEGALVHGAV